MRGKEPKPLALRQQPPVLLRSTATGVRLAFGLAGAWLSVGVG
jgi:hypothetical protein